MTDSTNDETVTIPGLDFHIDLSALDARHPIHYSRRLHIFRCASSTQRDEQLAAFKAGLKALLQRCPFLGGIIAPLPAGETTDDQWRTILPGPGVELVIKDVRTSLPSFMELEADAFPPQNFPWKPLMPIPKDLDLSRRYAAFKVQFSAIEGGVIITFAMSHSVADGNGMDELMRVLIEEVRLAPKNLGHMATTTGDIGMDRSPIRSVKSDLPFTINDHPAYRWRTEPLPPSPHPFEATSPEVPILFRISPSNLARLKADATVPDATPISTHGALCALIWRSIILIRSRRSNYGLSYCTTTNLFMPTDARRHLGLPPSYVGNAVYQLIAALELGTLLSPSGLPRAAYAVRHAIKAITPDRVASYMNLINNYRDKAGKLGWQFEASCATTGVPMGTCFGSTPVLYSADWGDAFGPTASFRLVADEGTNCVMPKLPDGTAEVIVSVMREQVPLLKSDECFGKYCN